MLITKRLLLSPLGKSDAEQVQRLFRDPEMFIHSINLPHPFDERAATTWIENLDENYKIFTIRRIGRSQLVGVTGLHLQEGRKVAEYGCWVGVPYRGKGYGSEASHALFRYGFMDLNLQRIFTSFVGQNKYSKRILKKLGMYYEGCLRQHLHFSDQLEDLHFFGILRDQYFNQGRETPSHRLPEAC